MSANWQRLVWKLWVSIPLFTAGVFAFFGNKALAQITPDSTLGAEGSQVTPASPNVDRIDGGAIRGTNLFHSFQDFNVGEGRGAYFANPAGIENILSRVTGGNPSKIFGTLGVLGNANLYLLNPNGIIFGPNARLDIRGSFVGSTADSIVFGDRTLFRATDTQTKPLLTVAVPVGLQYGTQQAGAISNAGNLAVGQGQKLALVGGTVTSSGQLTAPGGTVQVLGDRVGLVDNARIDVSGETGGGTVLIGGDFQGKGEVPNAARTFVGPGVTINADALSSGDGGRVIVWADEATGFYGNISARGGRNSGNGGFVEVSGKQNLAFQGNVNLSAPNGTLGTLLLDPENIRITNAANAPNDGQLPNILFGVDPGATYTISNTALQSQVGNVVLEATNNINVDNGLSLNFNAPGGSIRFTANANRNGSGSFFMDTGQTIKTNGRAIDISGASILLGNIDTSSNSANGGNVTLDAKNGDITTGFIQTDINNNRVADVSITSRKGSISINNVNNNIDQDSIFARSISINALGALSITGFLNARSDNNGNAGDIKIGEEPSLIPSSITLAGISTRNLGGGNGGRININTKGNFEVKGAFSGSTGEPVDPNTPSALTIASEASRNGGAININAEGGINIKAAINSNNCFDGSNCRSSLGGNITLNSNGDITTGFISTAAGNDSKFADVTIKSRNGSVSINGFNNSNARDSIFAKNITINTLGTLFTSGDLNARSDGSGSQASITIGNELRPSSITTGIITARNNSGDGGKIRIETTGLLDVNAASTRSGANIIAPDVSINDGFSIGSEANGNGGDITINADRGIRTVGGIVTNSCIVGGSCAAVSGNGGNITLNSSNGAINIRAGTVDSSSRNGNGGNIKFDAAGNINVGSILSNSSGNGRGGDITLISQGGTINTTAGILNASAVRPIPLPPFGLPVGDGGNITLDAKGGNILSGSIESTGLQGGSITLNSGAKISLNQADIASISTGSNTGSNISFTAKQVELIDARIGNIKSGEGQGGNIIINASDSLNIKNTNNPNQTGLGSPLLQLFTSNFLGSGIANTTLAGTGNGGNITIDTKQLTISNEATSGNEQTGITTSTRGIRGSRGGDITIKASESVTISGNQLGEFIPEENQDTAQLVNNISTGLTTAALGEAKAGNLTINTGKLVVQNGAGVSSGNSLRNQEAGKGDGGDLTVNASQSVELTGKAALATSTSGSSNPGTLVVKAGQVTLKDGALFAADTLGNNPAGNVEIVTNQLRVQNGSRIGSATAGSGTGGSIKINTPDKMAELVEIDGTSANGKVRSGIFTNSQGSGKAGDIEIYTDKLNVLNRGEISVSGNSSGASGDINVIAGNISMTQQAGIRATTNSGEGGNINLTVADSINMKNDGNPEDATEITARAFGTANGGNITLRVGKFILGKLSENNDIVAEAFGGNGGRIDAKAALSFEFVQHEKGRRIPESEFIASSTQGLNGIVNVSNQDFQPIPIPDVPIVREVPQVCPTSPGVTTRPAGRSAFSNAGRGGLPPNPGDALESNIVQVPWVTLDSDNQNSTSAKNSAAPNISLPETIEEAQGWVRLPNGKVLLTTKTPTSPSVSCIFQSSQQ